MEELGLFSLLAKSDYTIAISMASRKFKLAIKKAKKEARPAGGASLAGCRRGLRGYRFAVLTLPSTFMPSSEVGGLIEQMPSSRYLTGGFFSRSSMRT